MRRRTWNSKSRGNFATPEGTQAGAIWSGRTRFMTKVLFVCMGNICRSPMAEGNVFRKAIEAAGLDRHVVADSAGTHAYHVARRPIRGASRRFPGAARISASCAGAR